MIYILNTIIIIAIETLIIIEILLSITNNDKYILNNTQLVQELIKQK